MHNLHSLSGKQVTRRLPNNLSASSSPRTSLTLNARQESVHTHGVTSPPKVAKIILSFASVGSTRNVMPHGPARGCRRKQSGKEPRGAGLSARLFRGETTRRANIA